MKNNSACKVCKSCYLIFPVAILLLTLMPGWYGTNWAKWALILVSILMLLKKLCPCNK
jgi:hypothetical protein